MRRNIVLLILDTVRKDYFDNYANNLKRESDISFDNAYAASSWSTPSHASIFTGELPHQHDVHANSLSFKALGKKRTFLTDLSEFQTIGTSTNVFAGPEFGFDSLFDSFIHVSRNGIVPGGLDMDTFSRTTESSGIEQYKQYFTKSWKQQRLFRSVINGITAKTHNITRSAGLPRLWDYGARAIISGSKDKLTNEDRPYFYFANFMEAHSPYEDCLLYYRDISAVPRGWSDSLDDWVVNKQGRELEEVEEIENRRKVYSGAIDYLDKVITPFIKRVIEKSNHDTTVIITADHGEALAHSDDPPRWGHVGSLSHSLLHVPLEIINPPEGYSPDTQAPFSHLDLGELILSLSKNEPVAFDRSIVPAERIGLGVDQEIGPADYDYWNRGIRCVYEGNSRIEWDTHGETKEFRVESPSKERFVQELDETPEKYQDMFDESIEQYSGFTSNSSSESLSEDVREGLEDLGYM